MLTMLEVITIVILIRKNMTAIREKITAKMNSATGMMSIRIDN